MSKTEYAASVSAIDERSAYVTTAGGKLYKVTEMIGANPQFKQIDMPELPQEEQLELALGEPEVVETPETTEAVEAPKPVKKKKASKPKKPRTAAEQDLEEQTAKERDEEVPEKAPEKAPEGE